VGEGRDSRGYWKNNGELLGGRELVTFLPEEEENVSGRNPRKARRDQEKGSEGAGGGKRAKEANSVVVIPGSSLDGRKWSHDHQTRRSHSYGRRHAVPTYLRRPSTPS